MTIGEFIDKVAEINTETRDYGLTFSIDYNGYTTRDTFTLIANVSDDCEIMSVSSETNDSNLNNALEIINQKIADYKIELLESKISKLEKLLKQNNIKY